MELLMDRVVKPDNVHFWRARNLKPLSVIAHALGTIGNRGDQVICRSEANPHCVRGRFPQIIAPATIRRGISVAASAASADIFGPQVLIDYHADCSSCFLLQFGLHWRTESLSANHQAGHYDQVECWKPDAPLFDGASFTKAVRHKHVFSIFWAAGQWNQEPESEWRSSGWIDGRWQITVSWDARAQNCNNPEAGWTQIKNISFCYFKNIYQYAITRVL